MVVAREEIPAQGRVAEFDLELLVHEAVPRRDVLVEDLPPVEVLEGHHRLEGHVHDGLCGERHAGRDGRGLVLEQEPLEVAVALEGVDEQGRAHLRLAKSHDAVDVPVVGAVQVQPLLEHHRQLHAARLIYEYKRECQRWVSLLMQRTKSLFFSPVTVLT